MQSPVVQKKIVIHNRLCLRWFLYPILKFFFLIHTWWKISDEAGEQIDRLNSECTQGYFDQPLTDYANNLCCIKY